MRGQTNNRRQAPTITLSTITTQKYTSYGTGTSGTRTSGKIIGGTGLSMVIDNKVNQKDDGIFYLLPSEMGKSGLLNPGKFDSVEIRNVEVDDIRPTALLGILSSLKPNGTVRVLVCQPIAVMQPYEADMIAANAKLAGFINIKTSPAKFFNEFSKKEDDTLCVTFTKPEKPVF